MPEIGPPMWKSAPGGPDGLYAGELREPERYTRIPGRHYYEALYISSLNRIPVAELADWGVDRSIVQWPGSGGADVGAAQSGVNLGKPIEWTLLELYTRRLVDGYLITLDTADEGLVFLDGVVSAEKQRVVQRFSPCEVDGYGRPCDFYETARDTVAVRVYESRNLGAWEVEDYFAYGTDKAKHLESKDYEKLGAVPPDSPIPFDALRVFAWDRGILEPAGFTLQAIERTCLRRDQYTDPTNNAVYTFGTMSMDQRAALDAGTKAKTRRFDLPGGTEVMRLPSTGIAGDVAAFFADLMPLMYAATGVVKLSETAALSGRAREIALFRMRAGGNRYRAELTAFIEAFGGAVQWSPFVTLDASDRALEWDLLDRGRSTVVNGKPLISEEEYTAGVRALIGY